MASLCAIAFGQVYRGGSVWTLLRPDAYGPAWNGDTTRAGSANAVYDKIESLGAPPGGISPWIQSWLSEPNMADLALAIALDAYIDLAWYDPNGDGVTDDAAVIQLALDTAVAAGKGLIIRRPSVAYRIDSPLTIDANSAAGGLHILGLGSPRLVWGGSAGSMVRLAGVSDTWIEGLRIDANSVADVNALSLTTNIGAETPRSSQRITLRDVRLANAENGLFLEAGDPNVTVNHFDLYQCVIADCNVGVYNLRGVRHLTMYDTKIDDPCNYGVRLAAGELVAYGGLFSGSGISDLYIDGNNVGVQLYGTKTISNVLLTTSAAATTHFGGYAANILSGVTQAVYPAPDGVVMNYDANAPLMLSGCTFGGEVVIGPNVPAVYAQGVQFDANDFSGNVDVLSESVIGWRTYSLTIDDPNSLVDPNVMMLRVAIGSFPYGMTVTALGIQTRPASTATVTFLDYNAPDDPSPLTLGTCSTSASSTDVNDIANVTVATGHTLVVSVPTDVDWNQLEAVVWGRPKAR